MPATALPDVETLRRITAERGGWAGSIPASRLARVLDRAGDIDLAATALSMSPRPAWVTALVEGED